MDVQKLRDEDTGDFPKYAWPGGYAIVYVADDGESICADCVNSCEQIHFDGDSDGWLIDGYYIADETDGEPYEATVCANCNSVIFRRDEEGLPC